MVLPWDLGNHESYDGNLVWAMLMCWEQAVHISKKETYLACCKPTLSIELVVHVVLVMDKI